MQTATLSFRAEPEFVEHTKFVAGTTGLKTADYIRDAVREKNDRIMADRMTMLSKKLSVAHLAFNEAIEGTLTDGLE